MAMIANASTENIFMMFALLPLVIFQSTPISALSISGKTSLSFQGDITLLSDPLPMDTEYEQLSRFFRTPEARIAFGSGGEEKSCDVLPIDSQWERRWEECCDRWYGSSYLPRSEDGDAVFSCDSSSSFPGITICTTVYAGYKQIEKSPRCAFLVIGQKQTARGLPPLVWLFHRLMGTKPKNNDDDNEPPGLPWGPIQSFYNVEQNPSTERWNLRLDSSMKVNIDFSTILLKSMPMSKTMAESQGSSVITKTIEKAGQQGLNAVRDSFIAYHRQSSSTATKIEDLILSDNKKI